ncbi:MAG TPA: DUF4235 domain-containing protein [Acidimicrobiales bacterium]|nr:DUF4235 domain-containing protein [Acidimicrobiales bacterium]
MAKRQQVLWKGVGALSGAVAGAATRKVLTSSWRKVRGGNPPTNPASHQTKWTEALIWAMASGVAMAVTRLVAQRGAAEAWRAKTGSYPEGLETVSP